MFSSRMTLPVRPDGLRSDSGRALPIVLVVLAIVALAVVFGGDLFGPSGDAENDGSEIGGDGYLDVDGTDGADAEKVDKSLGLAKRFGDGDLGAIEIGLFWAGSGAPVEQQSIGLMDRRGLDVDEQSTSSSGQAVFTEVAPGRGYSLMIRGEGFKNVHLQGISVRRAETTHIDDIYIGDNIVLRGRVVDSSGNPLPAASVSVFEGRSALSTDGVMFAMVRMALDTPSPVEQTAAGDDGYFTLKALDDGVYRLEARHSGFASRYEKDVVVQTDRSAGTLTLVLNEGAQLSGKVLNEVGKPVVGARVIALYDSGRWRMTGSQQREYTTTGENGEYVLDTLARNAKYRFGVVAEGFAAMFDTNSRQIDGDVTRNFELVTGGRVEGTVTDKETGKPVVDAQVAIYVGQFMNRDPNNQSSSAITRTDKSGHFVLTGVRPGPIGSAQIAAAGFVTESRSQWTQNQWPDVVADETTEVAAELVRGGIVRGFVKSTANEPIQGATVMLDNRASFWQGAPSTITNADGAYELLGVRPGEYGVSAIAEGFAPSGGEGARVTMPESGGTLVADVELTTAGVVRGMVRGPEGEPVVGVRVRVEERAEAQADGAGRGRGRGRGRSRQQRMVAAATGAIDMTGVDGKYELKGVGAGRWVVAGESDEFVKSYSEPFRIAAAEEEEVELTMVLGGVVKGRVVGERGSPVAGARVRLGHLDPDQARRMQLSSWRADRNLSPTIYTTDADGRFTATNLEPGLTLVKVEKTDYITFYKRNARVNPGGVVNYQVALSKGHTIEGVVRGADGKPLPGASVFATLRDNPRMQNEEVAEEGEEPEDVEPTLMARADRNGRYRIENMPPGSYSVVVGWGASGHRNYWQHESDAAIVRGVETPAESIDFKLEVLPEDEAGPRGRGG